VSSLSLSRSLTHTLSHKPGEAGGTAPFPAGIWSKLSHSRTRTRVLSLSLSLSRTLSLSLSPGEAGGTAPFPAGIWSKLPLSRTHTRVLSLSLSVSHAHTHSLSNLARQAELLHFPLEFLVTSLSLARVCACTLLPSVSLTHTLSLSPGEAGGTAPFPAGIWSNQSAAWRRACMSRDSQ